MKIARAIAAATLTAGMITASSAVAHAASPPPYGFWISDDGGSQLLVGQGQCSLGDSFGNITTAGSCSWNGTSGGGILTIMTVATRIPSPVYFNVVWVDPSTITVWGQYFLLQR